MSIGIAEGANSIIWIVQNNETELLQNYIDKMKGNDSLKLAKYSIPDMNNSIDYKPLLPIDNLTLLHIAAVFDSLECYILLIEKLKLSPRALSAASYYPLHYACFYSSYEIVSYTFKIDSEIALFPHDGLSYDYIYLTVIGGNEYILKELFKHGDKLETKPDKGKSIISKCILSRSVECLKILIQSYSDKDDSKGEKSIIMKAIVSSIPETIPMLVKSPDDLLFINSQGESAFSLACFYGNAFKKVLLYMLDRVEGNCIEPPSSIKCKGVCHWACQMMDYEIASKMLSTPGVNINRLDQKDSPGICEMASKIQKDASKKEIENVIRIIQLLIDKGFDINIRAPMVGSVYPAKSVLETFCMCICPNIEIIKYLISCGASLNALRKGQSKQTVRDVIYKSSKPNFKKLAAELKQMDKK